jgi:hypothetical protein
MRKFLLTVLFVLFVGVSLFSQQNSALVGTLVDTSGAAVPGADVTVTNQDTGLVRKVVTGGSGEYSVPNLPVGLYQVNVSAKGFKSSTTQNIKLDVQRTTRVDLTLQVGTFSETVTVTNAAPLLQTTESQVSTLIDNREILELPLNGRNYIQLNFLVPGTSHGSSNADYIFSTHGDPVGSFSVNGMRSIYNSYLIDGVPTNDVADGAPSFEPSIDAIEEFRLQTSNYTAQLGSMAGGQVNLVTKAGTNSFHGSVYEFLRNDAVAAKPFFTQPGTSNPALKRHNFGGALGGPISKDHTFFFASYEALRFTQPVLQSGLVPTQAMRSGDLSLLPSGQPNPTPIVNPITGTQFPNNQVPVNSILANYMQEFVPLPNGAYNSNLNANWFTSSPIKISHNNISGRIDHAFSSRNLFFGRWLYEGVYYTSAKLFPTDSYVTGSTGENFAFGSTQIIGANKVNEVRLAFNRFLQYEHNGRQGKEDVLGNLGIHGFCEQRACWGQPEFDVASYLSFGEHGNGQVVSAPRRWTDDLYDASDTFTYTRGLHTLKAGVAFDLYHDSFLEAAVPRGVYGFDGHFTDPARSPNVNTSFADFLLAYPQVLNASLTPFTPYFSYRGIAPWIQDDWRITPSLTFNLGLRYEWLGRPVSRFNDFASVDFEVNPPQLVTPNNAAQLHYPRTLVNPENKNFAPRIGFAWSPSDFKRLVVRGAWGIFYGRDLIGVWTDLTVNPPRITQTNFVLNNSGVSSDPNYIGNFNLADPLKNAFTAANGWVDAIQRNHRQALIQQWNTSLQYELARNTQVTVSYVGNKATHLQREYDINQPFPSPNPQAGVLGARPFPNFGQIIYLDSEGSSNYNSLQVEAEHRYSSGLSLLSAYTFAKCIDDNSGGDYGEYGGGAVKYMNIRNMRQMRGLCTQDMRQRFTTSLVYDLPFGRGKRFGSSLNSIAANVISDWQVSGIATLESGQPFSVVMPGDWAVVGDSSGNTISTYSVTPNRIGTCDLPSSQRSRAHWFNTAGFAAPPLGSFGNAGRDICTAPGAVTFDFGVSRNFALWRESHLQFRAEAFNAFNHPNLGGPDLTFGDSNFGKLTGAGEPRVLQFGLRLMF